VPRGLERLWNALSPYHEDTLIDRRAEALVDVWDQLKLPRQPQILAGE
jgi:5-aminolevulinate synthase